MGVGGMTTNNNEGLYCFLCKRFIHPEEYPFMRDDLIKVKTEIKRFTICPKCKHSDGLDSYLERVDPYPGMPMYHPPPNK